jgi:hypothetical protein
MPRGSSSHAESASIRLLTAATPPQLCGIAVVRCNSDRRSRPKRLAPAYYAAFLVFDWRARRQGVADHAHAPVPTTVRAGCGHLLCMEERTAGRHGAYAQAFPPGYGATCRVTRRERRERGFPVGVRHAAVQTAYCTRSVSGFVSQPWAGMGSGRWWTLRDRERERIHGDDCGSGWCQEHSKLRLACAYSLTPC